MTDVFAGLDLGGSRLKASLLDGSQRLIHSEACESHAAEGAESARRAIAGTLERLRPDGGRYAAVGVGIPGIVDRERGRLAGATPHLPEGETLAWRDAIERDVGCPVVVDNDANVATLAELRLGSLQGVSNALVVLIGTGVGAGLVVGGAVHRGARGGAGEIGHLPIGSGELACACGVPRCVEPDMSGEGVVRAARARGRPWTGFRAVWAAAHEGDVTARALIERLCDRLGASLAIAAQLLDPEVIVIGGGVSEAGDELVDGIREAFVRCVPKDSGRSIRLERSRLGIQAGAIGAALLAREHVAASAASGAGTRGRA
jgi:glucokinase